MSSLLEETIEAVARGLSTTVYQRPLTPRAPVKRKRPTGQLGMAGSSVASAWGLCSPPNSTGYGGQHKLWLH